MKNVQERIAVVAALVVAALFMVITLKYTLMTTPSAPSRITRTSQTTSVNYITRQPLTRVSIQYQKKQKGPFRAVDLIKGKGKIVKKGDIVYIYYVGMLPNGVEFDTSADDRAPFVATIGRDELIPGLDLGLRGMHVGGTRRISIPPELAYNDTVIADASGDVIIPASTPLTFDVVLVKVDKARY